MVAGVTPHDANSGDTVRKKQRQVFSVSPVRVHIPEAGDQELASGLHYLGILRYLNRSASRDLADTGAGDDHCDVRFSCRASHVNHGHMSEYERGPERGRALLRMRQANQEWEKQRS